MITVMALDSTQVPRDPGHSSQQIMRKFAEC